MLINGDDIGENDNDIGENGDDIGDNGDDIGDNGNNIGDNDNEIDENDYDIGDNDNIKDDIGDGILAVLLVSLQVPVHGSLLPESIEVFQPLSISHFLKVNFPNYL